MYQRVSARTAKNGARSASRSRRKVPRERIAGCRRDNNNRRSCITNYKRQAECVSIFYFPRGSRVCERKKSRTHGSDFILNVMTLPQAFKRHSDRARVFLLIVTRRGKEREGERKTEGMFRRNFSSRVAPRRDEIGRAHV